MMPAPIPSSLRTTRLLLLLLLLCLYPYSTFASESLTSDDFLVTGLEEIQPAFASFNGTMYAGRLPTNNQDGKLMFWLYESSPENDNLVIWLNGGPGCSSFGGMLFENAPVTVPHFASGRLETPTSPPLIPNNYSWTLATNMLYVEQPAGTGFSSGSWPKNESDLSSDFYGFLTNFYNVFPDMRGKDLYVFGESYAGMYVPSIARKIHLENKQQPKEKQIALKGIALGNGWIDATVQGPAVIDYAWWHGLIDLPTKQALHQQFEKCLNDGVVEDSRLHSFTTPHECGITEAVQRAAGMGSGKKQELNGPNIYDVSTWDSYPVIFDPNGTFHTFFNSPRVQEILHAPRQDWHICLPGQGRRRRRLASEDDEMMLDHDRPVSVVPYIAELLDDAKIRVLIYNGDRDMSCNAQGSEMLLGGMKWSGAHEWKTAKRGVWLVDDEPSGYSRSTKNLDFLVVYNSGHLLPMNQPRRALDLVTRLVNGASFNDATLPVFKAPSDATANVVPASNTSDCDTWTGAPQPAPRRRHAASLIFFSLIIGFAGGVFYTSRDVEQSHRRQQYAPVPEVEPRVQPRVQEHVQAEVSSAQYPWRWWSSHHDGQGNPY